VFCARKKTADSQKSSGKRHKRDEEDIIDDLDTSSSGAAFWRVPPSPADWRDNLTIDLKADEAAFLREKITTMPTTRDSLFALILRDGRQDFTEFEKFEELDGLRNIMPTDMCRDYQLARDFSRFVFGAHIRYNVIFSEGRNDKANEEWDKYIKERPFVNLSERQVRLHPRQNVMCFLKQFQQSLDNTAELDSLITRREKELKGTARAKLTNKELYQYNDNSINMERLVYRLPNVQRLVRDIFEGVGLNA
jgi:hypothetical protein